MKSAASAAVSTGNENRISTDTATMFHVKIGMRNIVMPGARIPKIVAIRLTAPRIDEVPTSIRPTIQRSAPAPGEYLASESGA